MRYFKEHSDARAYWRVSDNGTVEYLTLRGIHAGYSWGPSALTLDELERDMSVVECYEDGRLLSQYRYFTPKVNRYRNDPIVWRVGSIVEHKTKYGGWCKIASPTTVKEFLDCCPRQGYVECDINGNPIVEVVTQQVTVPRDEPVESPEDWVIQDRVPARANVDKGWWVYPNCDPPSDRNKWWDVCESDVCHGEMHGYVLSSGQVLQLACRRKDLPHMDIDPVEPVDPPTCRLMTARNLALILQGAMLVIDNDELCDTADALLQLIEDEINAVEQKGSK